MHNQLLRRKFITPFLFSLTLLLIDPLQAEAEKDVHPLLKQEALEVQENLIQQRPYSINRNNIARQSISLPSIYGNDSKTIPPWWSPKRGNKLSQFLAIALAKYPGLKINKVPTWDQIILKSEVAHKTDIESGPIPFNPLMSKHQEHNPAQINLSFLEYSSIYLKPRKRGVGLGLVSFTNKSCSVDSHLTSNLSIKNLDSSNLSTGQLLTQSHDRASEGGTSLSLNLGLAGVGGGNFDTPKINLKKLLMEHVADTAEGIYCIATNNAACLKFYSEREPLSHKKYKEKDIAKSTEC